ncbi:NADH oxidase family-domain-containing protein [Trametes maxima]|nr:NADH oxidase family-domain-containing protein [Trametes maxima]
MAPRPATPSTRPDLMALRSTGPMATLSTSSFRTFQTSGLTNVENRARFALEIVDAIVAGVGQSKAAIRLSPWNAYQDMRMDNVEAQFGYLVEQLKQKYPDLAFIHAITPAAPFSKGPENIENEDFIYKLWAPRPVITTGGYDRASAHKVTERTAQIVGFGRLFLANPDLPFRLLRDIPLNEPEFATFFRPRLRRVTRLTHSLKSF